MQAGARAIVIDCAWCHGRQPHAVPSGRSVSSGAGVSHGICERCLERQLGALAPCVFPGASGARRSALHADRGLAERPGAPAFRIGEVVRELALWPEDQVPRDQHAACPQQSAE